LNWKVVVVLVALGIAAYFGYRQWNATTRAHEDFCQRMMECSAPDDFTARYGDRESCVGSDAAARAIERLEGCDPTDECEDWLACGFGTGREADRPGAEKHETNFDQVLPHLE